MTRCLRTAQHEAAHVVVGCALGLRLQWARVYPPGAHAGGETLFSGGRWLAFATMYAAGVAWEELSGGPAYYARADRRLIREAYGHAGARADVRTAVACADAILHSRMGLHARVARLLAERDITGVDVERLVERAVG